MKAEMTVDLLRKSDPQPLVADPVLTSEDALRSFRSPLSSAKEGSLSGKEGSPVGETGSMGITQLTEMVTKQQVMMLRLETKLYSAEGLITALSKQKVEERRVEEGGQWEFKASESGNVKNRVTSAPSPQKKATVRPTASSSSSSSHPTRRVQDMDAEEVDDIVDSNSDQDSRNQVGEEWVVFGWWVRSMTSFPLQQYYYIAHFLTLRDL